MTAPRLSRFTKGFACAGFGGDPNGLFEFELVPPRPTLAVLGPDLEIIEKGNKRGHLLKEREKCRILNDLRIGYFGGEGRERIQNSIRI